jgi:O-antigen ligase
LASAAGSVSHDISFEAYFRERALLFAALLGWMRAAECDRLLRRRTAQALAGWLAAIILIAGAISVLDGLGSEALREKLVDWKLIYLRGNDAGPGFPDRRLQFPMLHFNRTAYYGMLAMFALLAAACDRELDGRRTLRTALYGTASVAIAVILLSYTRGIILSTVAGLGAAAALGSRKLAVGLAAALLLAGVALNSDQRHFLLTVFDPATYRVDQGELTSMKARLLAYRFGVQRIEAQPLTGMGYGDRIVRAAYEDYLRHGGDPRALASMQAGFPTVHLHNVWLETGAESGLLAVLAFLGFMAARWGLLWRRWREARGPDRRPWVVWIGLEAALFVAGMVFYMLKQNSGMLTWELWGFVFVAAADPAAGSGEPAPDAERMERSIPESG